MDLTRPIRLITALGILFSMAAITDMYMSAGHSQAGVQAAADNIQVACNTAGRITVAGRPDCGTGETTQ